MRFILIAYEVGYLYVGCKPYPRYLSYTVAADMWPTKWKILKVWAVVTACTFAVAILIEVVNSMVGIPLAESDDFLIATATAIAGMMVVGVLYGWRMLIAFTGLSVAVGVVIGLLLINAE